MNWFYSTTGGRKVSIFLIGSVLVALNEALSLGLSEDAITKIVTLAAVAIGGIALEDGLKELMKKNATAKGGSK